jgi:putative ABC transport system permease protein
MPTLRSLGRVPLLSSAVAITFAVATSILAIVFALVWHILVRQMPFADAQQLVFVWNRYGATEPQSSTLSAPDYNDYRHARAFSGAAAWTPSNVNLTEGEPKRLSATKVTPDFFRVLGVAPAIGADFGNDPHAVILSDAAWRTYFGARKDLTTIQLDGVAMRVAGIMPRGFAFPDRTADVWIPLTLTEADFADANRGNENLVMIARLRDGVSVQQAQAEIDVIRRSVFDRVPDRVPFLRETKWHVEAFPLRDDLVRRARPALLLLLGAALLVTLLAAANVMGLFLARTVARQRELAVRAALGARRRHIVITLTTEILALAAIGVTLGLLVARAALPYVALEGLPRANEVRIDFAVVAITASIVLASAALIGLGIALWASSRSGPLGERATTANISATRLRATLVAAQVAIAVTLLTAGAMLAGSYKRLRSVELGFDPNHVLTFAVELPRAKYPRPQRHAFFLELQQRLAALPGVSSASFVTNLPLSPNDWTATFDIEGYDPNAQTPHAHMRVIAPDYARTMKLPVLLGRAFTEADRDGAPRVALIDDAAAKRYFPHQNAIGHRVIWNDKPLEIIGVLGSTRTSLADDAEPHLYYPRLQTSERALYGVVRTTNARVANDIRAIVRSLDPAQPVYAVQPLDTYLDDAIAQPRLRAAVVAASAIVAILLALTGLYALLAYIVVTRTREVGLRIALGATPSQVMRFVARWSLRITAAGIVFGLLGAIVMTRSMRALLFGVDPLDPLTYAFVVAAFVAVALAAGAVPAFRAARIDPAVALRQE